MVSPGWVPWWVWPLLMVTFVVTLVAGSQLFVEPPLFLTHPQYKARFIRPVIFALAAELAFVGVCLSVCLLLPAYGCWSCPASVDLQVALPNVGNAFRGCLTPWLPEDTSAKGSRGRSVLADLLSQALNAWHTLGKGLGGKCTVH